VVVYGIPNCDSVKKARAWLAERGIDHRFHDFRKAGLPADRLDAWIAAAGWERVLNRKGTTWRPWTTRSGRRWSTRRPPVPRCCPSRAW
jgi:arsenate reductase-like glutaredoxin family protein